MNINRSGFYKWLNRRSNPSNIEIKRNFACKLFNNYHNKFPSHGYRWLNAKIKLDEGIILSDNYAIVFVNILALNLYLNMLKDMVKKLIAK